MLREMKSNSNSRIKAARSHGNSQNKEDEISSRVQCKVRT